MNAYSTQWSGLTAHARTAAPRPNRARFIVLPFVLGGSTVLGLPVAQAATSSIEQVIVYQGLASVTRSLPITGSGEQTVVFSCLSPYMDKESLSVQAVGNVNIGEISIEELTGEQAIQCQYQGDAEVQTQQNTLASINAELEAARLAKTYLQNLTKATQVNTEGTIASNARDIEAQATRINQKILDIQQRQARAQDTLNQMMASSVTSTASNVTQVSVRTASRAPSSIKLHYQVQGAGWEPTYQARLNTNSEQLNIIASAIIAQQTGENWTNVPVTLSTANPNQRATGRLPHVPRLSLYEENQKVHRVTPMEESLPVVVSAREGYSDDSRAPNMAPLPNFTVSSQNKNGIIEYRLPQRVTIPSGGRRVRTVIGEQSGSSKLWVRSTPSVETAAYWYASAPFLTPEWVDGSLQLYRDDNYVGQSRYNYQMLKEQGIGFGRDPSMMVKALINEDKQGEKGVLNRTQTLTTTQAYEFTNQHNRTVRLQVLGSEPISRDDSLKVAVTHTPPVTERNWNDNQGMVAWEFNVPSKQSQVIRTTSQISYPANKILTGDR
ncbi:mucoidy inhibitor MuiA family protein [Psychrobacter sp. KCTC 72983]|uniref:mucoidy inhibitor MuiA family protein n=1 Tax=Psychrobacter sp. KCTC 72983 TaxID=2733866 RepID=UPI00164408F4|nr:mucoidy inhibitor MuiA family protein [Psychrobacter sp. KCTC 72983]